MNVFVSVFLSTMVMISDVKLATPPKTVTDCPLFVFSWLRIGSSFAYQVFLTRFFAHIFTYISNQLKADGETLGSKQFTFWLTRNHMGGQLSLRRTYRC